MMARALVNDRRQHLAGSARERKIFGIGFGRRNIN